MRVLVISAALPPMRAGEADHALHLCRNLAKSGLEVHVLTTKGIDCAETLFKVHSITADWSWRDLPRFGKFLKTCAPDGILLIYSGWIYKDHPMITFAPTLAKRLLPHVPFVTQFEFEYGANLNNISFLARLIRKVIKQWVGPAGVDWEFGTLLRDSDTVIVLSENYRKKFSQHLPHVNEKTVMLPPPPLLNLAPDNNGETRRLGRNDLGIKSDEFLLAYFGYVHHYKGLDVLLKAVNIISKERSNVRLVIIGGTEDDFSQQDGSYSREMATLTVTLGISEKIIWTGKYAADSDYASVCLRSADACVLPYDKGVTLNRSSFAAAVAHGLPTITTKGETLEPQFIDRKNVLLCPSKDHIALADVINELIGSPELQSNLKCGALELANEWFSWDKVVEFTTAALKGSRLDRGSGTE
jgi:glycosyltransferase involved in cell wall biosynthesis